MTWQRNLPQLAAVAVAVGLTGHGAVGLAQERNPAVDCQLEPGAASGPDADTLSEILDECAGVLRPPPTGDSEIVLPAPEVGEIEVIPPGSLPNQTEVRPNGYQLGDIVDAIAASSDLAARLADFDSVQRVAVVDVSVLFQSNSLSIVEAALERHQGEVDQLRSALFAHETIAEILLERNVPRAAIVAIDLPTDGSMTVFILP